MYDIAFTDIPLRADWIQPVEVVSDDTGEPMDLTGTAISVKVEYSEIRSALYGAQRTAFDLSEADDTVRVIAPGVFEFRLEASRLGRLSPGTYPIACLLKKDGDTDQLFTGTVTFIA
jgi:hypothetical protein